MAQNKQRCRQVIEELRQKLSELESSFRPAESGADDVIATGIGPLNPLLPGGGLGGGTVVEWLSAGDGAGTCALTFRAALPWLSGGRICVVIDAEEEFYPPFLAGLGIDLEQIVLVRPTANDVWWALEQALRCRGVSATIGWLGPTPDRVLHRLRVAAETGGGVGFLLRPEQARTEPTWCHVRLLVTALPSGSGRTDFPIRPCLRRTRIEVLYCQGGQSGGVVEVDIDEETNDVRVVAPLAPARDARQAT